MKTIKVLSLFFAIILIGQSCRKDGDDVIVTPPNIEPKISVISSVIGTVTDEMGVAIEDALVSFEDKSARTDEFGVFQFEDESLYSNGTYIKVKKDGYFLGSRRFYPSPGNTSMISVELIPLNKVGDFTSSEGSIISFEDVELDFKENSIISEDGTAFSGTVNVAAKYLDPTLLSTLDQMPGDLTGRSNDQRRVVLTSMAMIAVELYDNAGNELQVQEGKTVDVKIPVPQDLLNDAPSSIPMWHFDEVDGIWVEEGSADLVNGIYETSLGHFSFWNCDVPNDFIFLKGSIVNRGVPIQGATIVITETNGGTAGSAITGPDGFFCGFVPNGVDLTLEVFDQCGNLIYTTTIPATEVDVALDPINLFIETNVATISGSVALCEGIPSTQTFVSVSQGDLNNIISVNDDLTFSGNIFYCDSDSELLVAAVDPINGLVSGTSSYSISGNLDVGEIVLCEEQILSSLVYQYGDVSLNLIFDGNASGDYHRTYSVQNITSGKAIYTVTILKWVNTGFVSSSTILYDESQPLQEVTMEISESGFKASGIASTQKITQDGIKYLVSTGTLPDIEIIDEDLYDPSYDELFYFMAFEID